MAANDSTQYINSTNYKSIEDKLRELKSTREDLGVKQRASRKLRYADIDLEAERGAGRLQPDELYIPQHIIDTNIRREQSPYVQYITQSPRAVICEDSIDATVDLSLLERDLTKKIRFDGWQMHEFANIDCFQQNGYGIMEVIQDETVAGGVSCEAVQWADFAFTADTRDLQACEYVQRDYFFTKTRLLSLVGDPANPKDSDWDAEQVNKIISSDNDNDGVDNASTQDRSLHRVSKLMFRVSGVVNVAWYSIDICDDWARKPRPLFIGRRKLTPPPQGMPPSIPGQPPVTVESLAIQTISHGGIPQSEPQYETQYPYFLFPYLISENDTITQLKGRVFLDQDVQEAVSSLLSSTVTKARRSAGLYFSKDVSDPNDDVLMKENQFFKTGSMINSKVKEMQLAPPDPAMFSAIQMLISGNQNETSQVNFAVQNRKDSRKTAEEIKVASSQAQILSTVQVVLFSLALKKKYSYMVSVIQSRVLAGLITVTPTVLPLYNRKMIIKPSGDTDVIERQQRTQTMMAAWPVIENTAAAPLFLADLLELMFPETASKYVQAIQQATQQQQGQQAQQMQMMLGQVKQMSEGIKKLADNPAMFSDEGRLHAYPIVEHYADMIKEFQSQQKQQMKGGNK